MNAKPARAKLARMQRDAQDTRAQNQQLQAENQQLHAENQQQQTDIGALRVQLQQAQTQLASTSTLPRSEGTELVALGNVNADVQPEQAPLQAPSAAMEELLANESLSEETRESAKNVLDVLASSQVRESENAALQKTQNAALRKLELEAQFKLDAEMMEWLMRHRLRRHAETIGRVAGLDAAPSDLLFLTEDDIADIGSGMTNVEKMRLQVALEALRDEGQGAETAVAESERE